MFTLFKVILNRFKYLYFECNMAIQFTKCFFPLINEISAIIYIYIFLK